MRACVVIPVYNHEQALPQVIERLRPKGLPLFLVDDGSDATCARALAKVARGKKGRHLITLSPNQGKGAAVLAGLKAAAAAGYTHALQIDADGQHDSADAARFLAQGQADPAAVVCGSPLFDTSIPASRLHGRKLTTLWVWINSLSLAIDDALCGYRLYPIAPVLDIAAQGHLGLRMDFDPEIMVRMSWRGVRVVSLPTKVRYPLDGISHFKMWRDNVHISAMHARLFFGMLIRLPLLLWRKWAKREN